MQLRKMKDDKGRTIKRECWESDVLQLIRWHHVKAPLWAVSILLKEIGSSGFFELNKHDGAWVEIGNCSKKDAAKIITSLEENMYVL